MKNRRLLPWLLALSFVLLAAGCGGGGGKTASSPAASSSGASSAAASESSEPAAASPAPTEEPKKPVTLRIGTWEGGDAFLMQQQLAAAYMADHPHVTIEVESVPDSYGTKILTQVASGVAPDIFQIGENDIKMYVERGAYLDLTPFIDGDNGIDTGDYLDTVLNVGSVGGKLYALPKDYSDVAVYYNKKIFDEANIPYPTADWTWEQFYDIARQLTVIEDGKVQRWGVKLPGKDLTRVLPLIYAYGGDVISPDGLSYDGYLNSDATVAALQLYYRMYVADKLAPTDVDRKAFSGVNMFGAGRVAMEVHGTWPAREYLETPDLDFGTAAMPQGPGGGGNSVAYSGYGIYAKSAHAEEAWNYLKYLTGPEGTEVFAAHAFVAVKSVAEKSGQLTNPVYRGFADGLRFIKTKPHAISEYFNRSGEPALAEVLEKIVLGEKINVREELDKAAAKAEQLLKEVE